MEGEFLFRNKVNFGAILGEIKCGTSKDASTYVKFCVIYGFIL